MQNNLIGYQGTGSNPRPIYEIIYSRRTYRVATSVGSNGFIVGANPTPLGVEKMKIYKFSLEYQTSPIWELDENNMIVNKDIPYVLKNTELENKLNKLQDEFNSFYDDDIDDDQIFRNFYQTTCHLYSEAKNKLQDSKLDLNKSTKYNFDMYCK